MGEAGASNSHPSLPDKNSAYVSLELATPDEALAQQTANQSEWGGALPTLDAYLRREHVLASQEITRNGGLTSWVLVYQPPGSSKREVLCGCETIRKSTLIGRNGKVEEALAHAVGSVFCPPPKRGKGYAGRMMKDLSKKLQHWQTAAGSVPRFSVLFSDIGKQFYASHGWHPFPSSHISLPVKSAVSDALPEVRFLRSDDIPELCALDERMMRSRLSKYQAPDRTAVAFVPDSRTIRWHHAREEFVGQEVHNRQPTIKGAVVGEPGSRVWCYWTRVWTNPQEDAPDTLHILRLVVEDESFSDWAPASVEGASTMKTSATTKAVAALLAAAQKEASEWSMEEVQIWNPTSTMLAAAHLLASDVAVEHREKESITSLLWYGEGSWESVDWICNEKYGWC